MDLTVDNQSGQQCSTANGDRRGVKRVCFLAHLAELRAPLEGEVAHTRAQGVPPVAIPPFTRRATPADRWVHATQKVGLGVAATKRFLCNTATYAG